MTDFLADATGRGAEQAQELAKIDAIVKDGCSYPGPGKRDTALPGYPLASRAR